MDSGGPCALYIASDSRITWSDANSRWDSAQKTFISGASPDIFGYCGAAFLPTQLLNQVARQIEAGILFGPNANADERHGRWLHTIQTSVSNSVAAKMYNFSILHGSRDGIGMNCTFRLWISKYVANSEKWTDKEILLKSDRSHFVQLDGSGAAHLKTLLKTIDESEIKSTSRCAFQKFFHSLNSGADKFSGGAPQIVGLYRGKEPQYFGLIWKGERYFCGCKLVAGLDFNNIDWFNELFERADGKTKNRLDGAQKH